MSAWIVQKLIQMSMALTALDGGATKDIRIHCKVKEIVTNTLEESRYSAGSRIHKAALFTIRRKIDGMKMDTA